MCACVCFFFKIPCSVFLVSYMTQKRTSNDLLSSFLKAVSVIIMNCVAMIFTTRRTMETLNLPRSRTSTN